MSRVMVMGASGVEERFRFSPYISSRRQSRIECDRGRLRSLISRRSTAGVSKEQQPQETACSRARLGKGVLALSYEFAMKYRQLGRTPWKVSEIGFGAWAIGGAWGSVDNDESMAALHQAIDSGVNFIDTADVYGMGRSERLIAQLKRERKEAIVVATKAGRPPFPPTPRGGNPKKL